MKNIYVSKSGTKDFTTITEALTEAEKFADELTVINIANGTYYEKVTVSRPNIILIGEDKEHTIIEYDDYALKMHEDGKKYGTFRSYTLFLDNHDITLKNLTVRNMCVSHHKAGQALALYADGNHIYVENCILDSFQDTLFTGPLPPFPYSIGGFTGPKEFSERVNGLQYYKNTIIKGDVDFIFGSATAYFEDCEIVAKSDPKSLENFDPQKDSLGYLTAASTPEGQEYGYVFNNCRLLKECPDNSYYLGRPWRDFAKTVFINCYMDSHIKSEGFHDWNKENARDTVFYAEFGSFGPGAQGKRASFVKNLSKKEADQFSKDYVLDNPDTWSAYI